MFRALILFLSATANLVAGGGGSGWTYAGGSATCEGTLTSPCGPYHWGNVPGSSACSTERYQTPINLGATGVVSDSSIKRPAFKTTEGGCKKWTQFTSTGVFEVAFNKSSENAYCDNLKVNLNGEDYHLLQMHLHSPSEHTIGGGKFGAEAHMVHLSNSGKYLVVGVFLDVTPATKNSFDNNFFSTLWSAGGYDGSNSAALYSQLAEGQEIDSKKTLNPYRDLTPADTSMFHYNGSLTTPPCMVPNGVSWWLFQQPVMISAMDLDKIRSSVKAHPGNLLDAQGDNARPIQPLNGRKIYSV